MTPKRFWQEMGTNAFAAADTSSWIAVQPIAAIEQHGPHLPVATDAVIGEAFLRRAVELLPGALPVTFLPMQCVGKSNEHIASPGTLTLSWDTLTRLLLDIGDSVARAGVKKIVFANSHGGNVSVLDIVTRELRIKHGMLAVAAHWSRIAGSPKGLFSEWEGRYGIHGGEMETSVMLAARGDLVDMAKAKRFETIQERLEQRHTYLRAHTGIAFGWQAQDLSADGTVGNAGLASAEKGRAMIDHAAAAFVALMQDMHAFDMAQLSAGPGPGLTR